MGFGNGSGPILGKGKDARSQAPAWERIILEAPSPVRSSISTRQAGACNASGSQAGPGNQWLAEAWEPDSAQFYRNDDALRGVLGTQLAESFDEGIIPESLCKLRKDACDGTLGLKAISDASGLTFAQEPTSAKFDSMPRSAATTGVADHVMTPIDIAKELERYVQHLAVQPDDDAIRPRCSAVEGKCGATYGKV